MNESNRDAILDVVWQLAGRMADEDGILSAEIEAELVYIENMLNNALGCNEAGHPRAANYGLKRRSPS